MLTRHNSLSCIVLSNLGHMCLVMPYIWLHRSNGQTVVLNLLLTWAFTKREKWVERLAPCSMTGFYRGRRNHRSGSDRGPRTWSGLAGSAYPSTIRMRSGRALLLVQSLRLYGTHEILQGPMSKIPFTLPFATRESPVCPIRVSVTSLAKGRSQDRFLVPPVGEPGSPGFSGLPSGGGLADCSAHPRIRGVRM